MDAAVVQQFLHFFQDFLDLLQADHWPDSNTTEAEIKNAFLVAQHVDKIIKRLQKRSVFNEFVSTLYSHNESSSLFLKKCLEDPPKYVLKKIIKSKCKISQMDVGFKVFLQLYSESKLETYITDIMLEAASTETLLTNLSKELSKEKLLDFKSQLLLSELNSCEDPIESVLRLLEISNKDDIELLVVSLLNKDFRYHNSINHIVNAFTRIMSRKSSSDKQFWKLLFRIEEKRLVALCSEHGELFRIMSTALLDCGKLIREQMSTEYFYIDFTYSELVLTTQKIFKNNDLKIQFLDIVKENNADVEFWEHITS